MMTAQQIFNKVAKHLATQQVQSRGRAGGKCMYRGRNGTSCAVGCLIPDSHYRLEFDSVSDLRDAIEASPDSLDSNALMPRTTSVNSLIYYLPFADALRAGGVDPVQHLNLLRELQDVHDALSAGYSVHAVRNLLEIATDYNLDPSEIVPVE